VIARWCFFMTPPTRLSTRSRDALLRRDTYTAETCTMSTWPYRAAREQRAIRTLMLAVSTGLLVAACYDNNKDYTPTEPAPPEATVITASGNIAPKVDEYRALLGDPKNGGAVPGPAAAGRREVNWDGVPGANLNTDTFPGDFFNTTTKLGLLMATPGTGFRVSDKDFSDINAAFGDAFNAFSPAKTFAAVGSAVTDVTFQVAAATTPAVVAGFGVVFADVDVAGATKIEVFDKAGKTLGTFVAPVRSDANGHSFVGVKFDSPIIARVRITSGTGALGAQALDVTSGGAADLVVMDDFLFSEPVPQ
jgi:hypothetical protein